MNSVKVRFYCGRMGPESNDSCLCEKRGHIETRQNSVTMDTDIGVRLSQPRGC